MVPSYGEMDEEHTGYWEIIISRAILTAALILTAEGPSAVVDKLVTRSYDEPSPPKPEFGEDILEVARDMVKSRKDLDASKRSRETWDGLWQRSGLSSQTDVPTAELPEVARLHAELQAALR